MPALDQPRVQVSVAIGGPDGVVMVQEVKPDVARCWNLPGGHVQRGETLAQAAIREVLEETGLVVRLIDVVGVFNTPDAVRFVFRGRPVGGEIRPGADILEVRTMAPAGVRRLPDRRLDSPAVLRLILEHLEAATGYPLGLVAEPRLPEARS